MKNCIISNINEKTVCPFNALPEEIIAFSLEENALLTKSTIINNLPAEKLLKSFYKKRFNYQNSTKLGQILIKSKVITNKELNFALTIQKKNNKPLGEILVYEGLCTQDIIEECLEKQTKTRFLYKELDEVLSHKKNIVEKILKHIFC